jgi:hypothetical protein
MSGVPWLELVPCLALAIALAACAGLRAWLPLLLAGGLARFGYVELGPSFQFLGSDRALVLFGVATLLEIVADKVPVLDHGLDAISTVLRPAAGSLLAASVLWPIADPLAALALGVAVGAPSSLVPHAGKSLLRGASTTFTGGLANPLISVLEDVAALVMFVVSVILPLVVALAMIALAAWLTRRALARRPSALRHT